MRWSGPGANSLEPFLSRIGRNSRDRLPTKRSSRQQDSRNLHIFPSDTIELQQLAADPRSPMRRRQFFFKIIARPETGHRSRGTAVWCRVQDMACHFPAPATTGFRPALVTQCVPDCDPGQGTYAIGALPPASGPPTCMAAQASASLQESTSFSTSSRVRGSRCPAACWSRMCP